MSGLPDIPLPTAFDRAAMRLFPKWGREGYLNKVAAHMAAFSGGGYVTPGSPVRSTTQSWRTLPQDVNSDTLPKLERLRGGSRDLWMNAPLAVAALRRVQTNVVGSGLTLQSAVSGEEVGLSEAEAEAWQRNVERLWRYWGRKEADLRRSHTFDELQALALLSQLLSGDCFAVLPHVPRPGAMFDLRVQLIEADNICNPLGKMDSGRLAGGIEVDEWGAPFKYYMRVPLSMEAPIYHNSTLGRWVEIRAFGEKSGRRNVLHLYDIDRPEQRRGVPLLAPLLLPLKNIQRLSDAELTGRLVAAMFTVFVKGVSGKPLDPMFNDAATQQNMALDPNRAKKYELGPGAVIGLGQDQEIEVAKPDRGEGYPESFETFVMEVGAAAQIPYEVLMQRFGSSYSASKAAFLEARRFFLTKRTSFATKFCQEIYEAWLWNAVSKGIIKAPGFIEDPLKREAWCRARWYGPGMGQINPLDETKAALLRVEGTLSTNEKEVADLHGEDWESLARLASRERTLKKELNLPDIMIVKREGLESKDPNSGNNGGASGGKRSDA